MTATPIHLSLCIVYENESSHEQARLFSDEYKLPLFNHKNKDYSLQLVYGDNHVELYDMALKTSIFVDFAGGALAHRQQYGGGRGQAIAKAIGLKHGNRPRVLDVTAGLARDAYVLACLGCNITLVEQSPVLVELIKDGIIRGLLSSESAAVLTSNFNLHNINAIEYMACLSEANQPDVIYIDPMYPERKKSALVKKDMQILQHLLGKDENAEALLDAALASPVKRIVVKRPIHAEPVGRHLPANSVSSKKTRYDVYINH